MNFDGVGHEARLLLVDDDVVVLRALSAALAGYHNVRFATRAEDALKLIHEEPFELLLVDAELPGISGLGLLELLARRGPPVMRSLLVTSHRQPAIEASARLLGAVAVLYKPFTAEALRSAVEAALRHASSQSDPPGVDALMVEPFRVLILSDEIETADPQLEGIADLCGWVEQAGSVEQALTRAWDQSLDAIVVTANLRHLDPIGVVKTIRGEPALSPMPVVVMQNAAGSPDELASLQAGASDLFRHDTAVPIVQARLLNLMRSKRYAEFAVAAMRR